MTAPVLLVHGFGTSTDLTWRSNGWIDLLADEGREVLGVDLLGHGTAPKPTEPEDYADLGGRVLDAMEGHDVVDAIGFSMGAKTLLALAAQHPPRFGRLVVAGVGANLFRTDDHSVVVEAVRSGEAGDNPALRYFADLGALPGNDRAALAACMAAGAGRLDVSTLGAIQASVLVVLGDQDFAGPAGPLLDALPGASYVELARTDHAKTPKSFAFIDAALDFLRGE